MEKEFVSGSWIEIENGTENYLCVDVGDIDLNLIFHYRVKIQDIDFDSEIDNELLDISVAESETLEALEDEEYLKQVKNKILHELSVYYLKLNSENPESKKAVRFKEYSLEEFEWEYSKIPVPKKKVNRKKSFVGIIFLVLVFGLGIFAFLNFIYSLIFHS